MHAAQCTLSTRKLKRIACMLEWLSVSPRFTTEVLQTHLTLPECHSVAVAIQQTMSSSSTFAIDQACYGAQHYLGKKKF